MQAWCNACLHESVIACGIATCGRLRACKPAGGAGRAINQPCSAEHLLYVHLLWHVQRISTASKGQLVGAQGEGSGARVSRRRESTNKAREGLGGACTHGSALAAASNAQFVRMLQEGLHSRQLHLGAGRTVSVAMYGRSCRPERRTRGSASVCRPARLSPPKHAGSTQQLPPPACAALLALHTALPAARAPSSPQHPLSTGRQHAQN